MLRRAMYLAIFRHFDIAQDIGSGKDMLLLYQSATEVAPAYNFGESASLTTRQEMLCSW